MTDEEWKSLTEWETVDRSPITEEERKYICANLRADAAALTVSFARHNITAADEIERLIKERDAWRKKAEDKDKEIVMALGGREHPSRR